MLEEINQYVPAIVSVLATAAATAATLHIVLYKPETRAAIGWIGLTWLAPIVGVTLYLLFGINRIRRRAESLRRQYVHFRTAPTIEPVTAAYLAEELPEHAAHFAPHVRLGDHIVERPLVPGNRVEPLFDGDEAFPAMLEAIRDAEETVAFQSYIFDNDEWGRRFANALGEAGERGVDVRVLIDATGLRYSFPTILRRLKKRDGVRAVRFLPTLFPPHLMSMNLRNHRKIVVVDGKIGFAGGINIRDAHVLASDPSFPTRDLHFRIEGPVVGQLQESFVNDWYFASRKEELRGEGWFPHLEPSGDVIARGISDGPDIDLDKLPWTLYSAIAAARESIRIVTPYFIPDDVLSAALTLASLRNVEVDIVLQQKNNLPYVKWASLGLLRPLLQHGCNIWMSPPPFNHSKLMVVDDYWVLVGSANIDPRSLRLNFEFAVECYDAALAGRMNAWISSEIEESERMTLEEYDERNIFYKIRDGFFRLFSPYL